ncbi:MAG: membrane protein insertase YidC [Gammaproteobacteria bacterium]|nr:membrane protein insertase YidC [Gammaproteobacteria bacterium]
MLIVALCFVLLLMWQAWQQDYGQKPVAPTSAAQSDGPKTEEDVPQVPTSGAAAEAGTPSAPTSVPTMASTTPAAVRVLTDTVSAEIDENGTLSRLKLRNYKISLENQDPFELMAPALPSIFTAQSGLLSEQGAPNHHAKFAPEKTEYTLAENEETLEVKMNWAEPAPGINVEKFYRFRRDSYRIDVGYRVSNTTDAPWQGRMYGQFRRNPDESKQPGLLGGVYTYTGGVISGPEKPYEKISFSDIDEETLNRNVAGGWLAMIQHYFAGAWIPDPQATMNYYSKALGDGNYAMGMIAPSTTVGPGATEEIAFKLFVGPKVQKRLAAAAPGLDRTVDYGWLFFIAQPLYTCLQFIQGIVVNWGWAIIILTMLIKLLFFPLSNASYKSMARMRKLQPKMLSLRERYGDDKQKLNQAMMEMYRKEKINPLGGCLPILVQIPVFISLYWVLLETVELRQAPFMFWLQDLATHDPYYVLPVLMGISMFAQQRLNPTPPDPIQAKVMMALPIVFTFFFLFFPSGLVLYWLVNNLLSIAQQWVITRKIENAPATT